jgi:hypothetical protein
VTRRTPGADGAQVEAEVEVAVEVWVVREVEEGEERIRRLDEAKRERGGVSEGRQALFEQRRKRGLWTSRA